jgi:hypothetical protein
MFDFKLLVCIFDEILKTENIRGWAPLAHAYNPSYSGGKDQEDRGLRPAQANSS